MKLGENNFVIEFEFFLRFQLPKLLHLSPSKRVACELNFGFFANHLRKLEQKDREELRIALEQFCRIMCEISKWRAPKGYAVVPNIIENPKSKSLHIRYMLEKKPTDEN